MYRASEAVELAELAERIAQALDSPDRPDASRWLAGDRVHVQTFDLCQPATIVGIYDGPGARPLWRVEFDRDGGRMVVDTGRLHEDATCPRAVGA